jgi:probable rRNA maturation factor
MPSSKKPPIHFHFLQSYSLSGRHNLKTFIAGIFRKEKMKLKQVDYIFCSDEYLLGINRQFLGHDFYTDIITFNLAGKGEPVSAEIYISVDRVMENALQLKVPGREEMLRVMFHGVLHLCGYQDKSKEQSRRMRAKEDHYLKRFLGGSL